MSRKMVVKKTQRETLCGRGGLAPSCLLSQYPPCQLMWSHTHTHRKAYCGAYPSFFHIGSPLRLDARRWFEVDGAFYMDIIFLDFGTDEGDNASSNNNAQNRLYFVYLSVYLWNSEIRGTVKDGSLNTLYKRKKVPFLSRLVSPPADRISGTRLKGILNQWYNIQDKLTIKRH